MKILSIKKLHHYKMYMKYIFIITNCFKLLKITQIKIIVTKLKIKDLKK